MQEKQVQSRCSSLEPQRRTPGLHGHRPASHPSVCPPRETQREEGGKEGGRERHRGDSPLLLCRSASSRPPLSYKLHPRHWKMTSVTFQSSAFNLFFLPTFGWSVVKSSLHLPPTSQRCSQPPSFRHPPQAAEPPQWRCHPVGAFLRPNVHL